MATPAKPSVIRVDPLGGRNGWGETLRAVPAWFISFGIHAILVFIFWIVVGDPRALAKEDEPQAPSDTVNTRVEAPEQKEIPLTNVDEGIDPEVPTNYDVNRIEEVSVPGPTSHFTRSPTPPMVLPALRSASTSVSRSNGFVPGGA